MREASSVTIPIVAFPGTSPISTTVLGFGCASLGSRVGQRKGTRALSEAYDLGVRHFDVARSYGAGSAESILGNFIRGKRENVTVVTKAGIFPPANNRLLAKGILVAGRLSPRTVASKRRRSYEQAALKQSVHESLRQLSTDYIDILLLHELTYRDQIEHDSLSALRELQDRGLIRAYGVATHGKEIMRLERAGHHVPIPQVPCNVLDRNVQILRQQGGATSALTHSPFGGRGTLSSLYSNPVFLREASDAVDAPIRSLADLGRLMLACALHLASPGVVVCSMFDSSHIRQNVETATQRFDVARLEAFVAKVSSNKSGTS